MWTAHRHLYRCVVLLTAPLFAAGCLTAPKKEPPPTLPATELPPVQSAGQQQGSDPAPASPESKTLAWPYLFLSAEEVPRDQRAVTSNGLVISSDELDAVESQLPLTQADLELELLALHHLQTSGLIEDPRFQARARASLRAHLAELVRDHETDYADDVDPAAAYQRYLEESAQFQRPEFASIRMILVPTSAAADEALKRLADGEEFASVAASVSLHASRAKGGEIEPFSPGTYNADLEDLAFKLAPGEVGTVNTSGGVFIIEKVASTPASSIPFEEVKEQIEEQLRAEAREAALRQFEEKLRKLHGPQSAPPR